MLSSVLLQQPCFAPLFCDIYIGFFNAARELATAAATNHTVSYYCQSCSILLLKERPLAVAAILRLCWPLLLQLPTRSCCRIIFASSHSWNGRCCCFHVQFSRNFILKTVTLLLQLPLRACCRTIFVASFELRCCSREITAVLLPPPRAFYRTIFVASFELRCCSREIWDIFIL